MKAEGLIYQTICLSLLSFLLSWVTIRYGVTGPCADGADHVVWKSMFECHLVWNRSLLSHCIYFALMVQCTGPQRWYSMLTDTYIHIQTHEEDSKWQSAITMLTAHFTCGLMYVLAICKLLKCVDIHDTECPYWDRVSLNNAKPLKLYWYGTTYM